MKLVARVVTSTLVAAVALGCADQISDPNSVMRSEGSEIQAKKVADAQHGGRPLAADLTGAAEVPFPGDPDGSGSAEVTLNQGQGEVCFAIEVQDVDAIAAGHIHAGPAGVAGPVVVNFDVASNGLAGCVNAESALIKAIRKDPAGYYVNLHNGAFPAGALRGQLSK